MEQYVSQGVDLILWNPIDPKGSIAAADLCYEAGIPLIGIDNLCQSENMTTTVYSDNKSNGYMVGLHVGDNYYKDVTINSILISGEKGNAVGQERRTGLMAGIIGSRAGLDEAAAWEAAEAMNQELTDKGKAYNEAADFYILGQGWGNWTSEEGLPAAEDLLVANASKINLLLGENDNMLLGAMTAVENAGLMDQIYIAAAADGQKEAYKLIQDGTKYIATGLNAPPVIARGAVDIAIDILVNGVDPESYELTTTTPPAAITIENVAEFYDPNANF
jgi:ribose transport system substrate-binding protein